MGRPLSSLTIWQNVPGIGWKDLLRNYQGAGSIIVDENSKTVTAISPFGPGVFIIGVNTGGTGGGGGGAGLPGSGLILDLVAPLVAANPELPATTNPPSSTDISLSTESTATTTDAVSQPISTQSGISTGNANTSTTQETVKAAEQVSQNTGTATVSSSGNTTIVVPGYGDVVISFTKPNQKGT